MSSDAREASECSRAQLGAPYVGRLAFRFSVPWLRVLTNPGRIHWTKVSAILWDCSMACSVLGSGHCARVMDPIETEIAGGPARCRRERSFTFERHLSLIDFSGRANGLAEGERVAEWIRDS